MSDWQPIETIPGGGERVLIYIPNPNWAADGLITQAFGGDDGTPLTREPSNKPTASATHWMPLPAPPSDVTP